MSEPPNLILLGPAVGGVGQLTVEAQTILRRSRRAYALAPSEALLRHCESVGVDCVDLGANLAPGDAYDDAYLRVADFILERAIEERPVVVLMPGNPLFLNSVSRLLLVDARERGLSTQVVPGLSELDVVISYLGLDVGSFGLQIFEAQCVADDQAPLNPQVPLLVLQVAGVASEGVGRIETESPASYEALRQRLAACYAPEPRISLINPGQRGRVAMHWTAPLTRFEELIPSVAASSCLFVDRAT